jgi:hypothetical protein
MYRSNIYVFCKSRYNNKAQHTWLSHLAKLKPLSLQNPEVEFFLKHFSSTQGVFLNRRV